MNLKLRSLIALLALVGALIPVQVPAQTSGKSGSTTTQRPTVRSTSSSRRKKSAKSSYRSRQTAPTPERYKEIQEALAKKGYFKGDATGVWNQESIDALRRFQQDQNLEATGKLNSLSLIALGLGPKRETPVAKP